MSNANPSVFPPLHIKTASPGRTVEWATKVTQSWVCFLKNVFCLVWIVSNNFIFLPSVKYFQSAGLNFQCVCARAHKKPPPLIHLPLSVCKSDYGPWLRVTVGRLSCTASLILSINELRSSLLPRTPSINHNLSSVLCSPTSILPFFSSLPMPPL